jgi:DnaJ-domain-containing protein 1
VDIFDRLGNLIKTILDDDPAERGYDPSRSTYDADMKEAWEELESYMNDDEPDAARASAARQGAASAAPEALRKDFRNLEVPFGAPLNDVRRSYKKLMAAFHPDRHSADPDRFRTATEVTKKLNQSFQRIRSHYEARQ